MTNNIENKKEYFRKSYAECPSSKKLYYITEEGLKVSERVYQAWKKIVAKDAVEISTPVLVPTQYLKHTGHLQSFKEDLFLIKPRAEDSNLQSLALRPETVSSIFPHLKQLIHTYGAKNLKICQKGLAFRNERSSRDGSYRMCAFNQIELLCLVDLAKNDKESYFVEYQKRLIEFFSELNMKVEFVPISEEERPHYSSKTLDLYVTVKDNDKPIEVGCINDRGSNDLYVFSKTERFKYNLIQVSLGLDRIVKAIFNLN